jgi:hypothetical protein
MASSLVGSSWCPAELPGSKVRRNVQANCICSLSSLLLCTFVAAELMPNPKFHQTDICHLPSMSERS